MELARTQRNTKPASHLSGDISYVHADAIIDHFLILTSSPLIHLCFQRYISKVNFSSQEAEAGGFSETGKLVRPCLKKNQKHEKGQGL